MKLVILAAGRGSRMKKLTKKLPKPMLLYNGINLLEHKMQVLPDSVNEIILVIGYLGEKIKAYFGDSYKNIKITYVQQKEIKGTAHALWQCKHILNDPFIVLMGDDLYTKEDLQNMTLLPKNSWAILTYPIKQRTKASKIIVDKKGNFREIYEDIDGTSPHNLIYTGACLLTPQLFSKDMIQISNGEYGLPQTICNFVNEKNIKVLKTENWIRITNPEDLK
jgi:NDP-sugar pyrophosphorylase family protein